MKRGPKPRRSINFATAEISPPIVTDKIVSNENENDNAENKTLSYRERNGEIAWDSMRDSTKENLREFYMRPDVQEKLGIAEKLAEKKIDPEVEFADEANGLLDLLQPILALGSSKIYKVPMEITSKAYVFDEHMRRKLSPRMARLIDKWGPSILKSYKDEIGCGLILISCVAAQTKVMHSLERQAKNKVATMPTPPPQPPPPVVEEKLVATGD